jgi:hypothetical protein
MRLFAGDGCARNQGFTSSMPSQSITPATARTTSTQSRVERSSPELSPFLPSTAEPRVLAFPAALPRCTLSRFLCHAALAGINCCGR